MAEATEARKNPRKMREGTVVWDLNGMTSEDWDHGIAK